MSDDHVHDDDGGIKIAQAVLSGALDRGTCKGQNSDQQGGQDGGGANPAGGRRAARNHGGEEMRVDGLVPATERAAARLGDPVEHRDNRQREQPPGPQQGEMSDRDHRRRLLVATMAKAPAIAKAAG